MSDFKFLNNKELIVPVPPDGYEYKLVPKEKSEREKLEEQLAQLEDELSQMIEPSNEELIKVGKMFHPYYWKLNEKQEVENLLKEML